MRGVSYSNGRWRVCYHNAEAGIRYESSMASQEEAESVRKKFENKYGMPHGSRWRSVENKKVGNFLIIGTAGEEDNHKNQKFVAKNLITGEYCARTIGEFKKILGIPQGKMRAGKGKGYFWDKRSRVFVARIAIEGTEYELGRTIDKNKAKMYYKNAVNNWVEKGIKPPKRNRCFRNNKLGVKYIHLDERNKYFFSKTFKGKTYTKRLPTLQKAIAYRNQFLKEHNLPIPD